MHGLKHDLETEKLAKMTLEKSKALCEAQMNILDRKYQGNCWCDHFVFKTCETISVLLVFSE